MGPAWQPLTPRGVAAFAAARWGRLLLAQFLVALLAAATIVWFLRADWFPAVRQAILALPDQGRIESGRLQWEGDSPALLADGRFLALTVDLDHSGQLRSPAHVQIEFGRHDVFVISLLGYSVIPYPPEQSVAFNRAELQPWWGAWEPPILWSAVGMVVVALMAVWTALSTIYFVPVWLVAYFTNRDVTLWGAWKLSGAALLPGALLNIAGILFYGWGALDLVQLAAIVGAHFALGWFYLLGGSLNLARIPSAVSPRNPFSPEPADKAPAPAGGGDSSRGAGK